MKSKSRTLDEMYRIAGAYDSSWDLKAKQPKVYDTLRKRINIYEFYDEKGPMEYTYIKKTPVFVLPNPKLDAFALQYHWHTAFPSAAELEQSEA